MIASQNNIKILLLGDNLALSVLPASGTQLSPDNMPAGAIAVANAAGQRVVAADITAGTGKYKIVQSQGPGLPLISSDLIDFSSPQTVVNFKNNVATVEQVSYVGYAGGNTVVGTDDLPAVPTLETGFDGDVVFVDFTSSGNRQIRKKFLYVATTAALGETKTNIADKLYGNATDVISKMIEKPYKVERVSNNAGTEALGASDTLVATVGSKYVVITETGGVLPYLFAVGDYIRFGTALTDPVYKITATTVTVADGGTLTLDYPVLASASYSGVGLCEYITAADFETSKKGLKFTGIAKQYIPQVMRGYEKVRFTFELSDTFGLTGMTYVTAAAEGSGTFNQVSELERFSQMNQGNRYTSSNPPTVYINNTGLYDGSKAGFNMFSISFTNTDKGGFINQNTFNQELLIGGVKGTNTQFSDATDGLWKLLDTLYSGSAFTAWS